MNFREILFATGNLNKVSEINLLLKGTEFKIKSLKDLEIYEDIPEPFQTLKENAQTKVDYLVSKTGMPCFAEDTGLEVDALNGSPGVLSARYAGEQKNSIDNIKLLLSNLKGIKNRKARFRTVICYSDTHKHYFFEGIANGDITEKESGGEGFGYDPVFIPDGFSKTFAEMKAEEKIEISHRTKAFKLFLNFLKS